MSEDDINKDTNKPSVYDIGNGAKSTVNMQPVSTNSYVFVNEDKEDSEGMDMIVSS